MEEEEEGGGGNMSCSVAMEFPQVLASKYFTSHY